MSPSLKHLWDHRGVLYRAVAVRDEFGDTIEGWSEVTTPTGSNCRPNQTSAGNLADRGPGEQQAKELAWFMDKDFTDVEERDVLSIVTGPKAGHKYRIVSVTLPTGPLAIHHVEIMGEVWHDELAPLVEEDS